MPSPLEQAVRRLRRRIALGAWFGLTVRLGALLTLLGASLALFARALFGWPLEGAACFLLPVLLAPGLALVVARRRGPSDAALTSWLDLRVGARGTLVTSSERPDPRWAAAIERELAAAPETPAMPVGPPLRRFFLACAFALAALFVPLARPAPGPDGTLFEQLVAGLTEKLATLDELVELDEPTRRELTERIGRLAELVEQPAARESLLEAIDAVAERMRAIAGEAAESGLTAADLLARSAAEALRDPAGARALLEQALGTLDAAGLRENLPAGLAELARRFQGSELEGLTGAEISGEELREWAAALRDGLRLDLDALGRAGLTQLSERELAEMARSLAELVDSEHVCDAECEAGGTCTGAGRAGSSGLGGRSLGDGAGRPGRGGVNRGRADAALTWGEESDGADERFAANALPPARAADLEHSGRLGTSEAAPEVDARGEAAGTGAEVGAQGSATWHRRLAPRHQKAVQEFFGPDRQAPR